MTIGCPLLQFEPRYGIQIHRNAAIKSTVVAIML